jgi:hypothetical protein
MKTLCLFAPDLFSKYKKKSHNYHRQTFFNDFDCSSIRKKLNYIRPGSIFLICKKTVFNLERILIYGKLFHSKGGRSLDRIVRIR